MKFSVGGKEYEGAPLRFIDVRDLGKSGVMAKLRRFHLLEGWERGEVAAELVATSIRRAGGKADAVELMTDAGAVEGGALVDLVPEIMTASGFDLLKPEAGDPNAPSPGTEPTST